MRRQAWAWLNLQLFHYRRPPLDLWHSRDVCGIAGARRSATVSPAGTHLRISDAGPDRMVCRWVDDSTIIRCHLTVSLAEYTGTLPSHPTNLTGPGLGCWKRSASWPPGSYETALSLGSQAMQIAWVSDLTSRHFALCLLTFTTANRETITANLSWEPFVWKNQ
jgi:hypothetical protein